MDLSLSADQRAFRDLARDFLEREAVPHRMQWDHDESVDLAIVPKMAQLGFCGAEAGVAAAACQRHQARLLRPDRAGHRVRRGQSHLPCHAGRVRLGDQRGEAQGTSQIQKLLIGRAETGISAFG